MPFIHRYRRQKLPAVSEIFAAAASAISPLIHKRLILAWVFSRTSWSMSCYRVFAEKFLPTGHKQNKTGAPLAGLICRRKKIMTAPSIHSSHKPEGAQQPDALDLLVTDHRDVQALFQQFEAMDDGSATDRKKVAERICQALTLNIQIEERVFYPTLREFIDAREFLHAAEIEHAAAKQLIVQIHRLNANDALYAAKLKELARHIDRHVRIEEQDMFPRVRASGLDLVELGAQLFEAKELAVEGLTA